MVLDFEGVADLDKIQQGFVSFFNQYVDFQIKFNPEKVDQDAFDLYSAKQVSKQLVNLLNRIV